MDLREAAIIGGGPAGLQAALTLARMHVPTVLFDDGRYRNASSAQMHNLIGADGIAPQSLREEAHREIARYPSVRIVGERVVDGDVRADASFRLTTSDGDWVARRVLIASGVRDTLLPIAGLEELWGDRVLPCPYCHGHEFSDGPIAVISVGGHADHVGTLLRGLTDTVPVLAPESVRAVERSGSGVRIRLVDGTEVHAGCVFIPPNPVPRSELAEKLGAGVVDDGIVVDALGRTTRPGVWAAGDVARRLDSRIPASVGVAIATGLTAAADIAAATPSRVE